MKVIDRYIMSELAVPFLSILMIFTMLIILGNLANLMELLINRGAGLFNMLFLISYLIPQFLGFIIPIALFFSVIATMVRLSSDREIEALKASGISLYRIARPVFIFSLICWVLSTLIMVEVSPRAYDGFKALSLDVLHSNATIGIKPMSFNEVSDGLVIYAERVESDGKMRGVLLSDSRDDQHKKVIFAKKGWVMPGTKESEVVFKLQDGSIHIRGDVGQEYRMVKFDDFDFRLDLSKQMAGEKTGSYRMMYVSELLDELAKNKPSTREYNSILVSLNQKFAIPFMCIVFAILGVPFGILFQRSGKEPSYLICIMLMMVFFIVFMGGKRMGEEGIIDPAVSSWFPNILFFSIGIYLFMRVARDRSSWILEISQKMSAAIERFNEKIIGQKDF